ncbi:MAG: hypothetical protein MR324_12060, partial [Lachnospiraceae bacterium]|nr:hypothetical protein [Lachnospiraceae bacterium]
MMFVRQVFCGVRDVCARTIYRINIDFSDRYTQKEKNSCMKQIRQTPFSRNLPVYVKRGPLSLNGN